MKSILLLSDTHGFIDERILSFAKQADEIWHAGDWGTGEVHKALSEITMVRGVYGNIDGQDIRQIYPLNKRFECQGWDVWITHIGGYPGRYNPKIREQIYRNPPGLFICGHSHILKVMRDQKTGLMHMNPGAAGRHGFHKVRTMLRFQISPGKLDKLEAIELGPRVEGFREE